MWAISLLTLVRHLVLKRQYLKSFISVLVEQTRIQVVSWNNTSEQTQLLDLQHNSVPKFVLQNCDFWFWTIFNI